MQHIAYVLNVAQIGDKNFHLVNCAIEDDLQQVTEGIVVLIHMRAFPENVDMWDCFALKFTNEDHKIGLEVSRRKRTDGTTKLFSKN